MIKSKNIETLPVSSAQLDEISHFIALENDHKNMQSAYLKWWYYKNPSNSWSFIKVLVNKKLGGIATTNNFLFNYNGQTVKVAMPQKVLTAKSMRGKGLFSKAYFSSEENNLEEGVDFFLTFTNKASTPIFINKFKYSRGIAPKLYFAPSLPINVLCNSKSTLVDDIDDGFYSNGLISVRNSITKGQNHIQWRYFTFNPDQYLILKIEKEQKTIGYCILKEKILVAGVKAIMLMDLIIKDEANIKEVLKRLKIWSAKSCYLGILFLQNDLIENGISGVYFNTFKKFNFLIKGTSIHRQSDIEKCIFNFFLGDLDFL
jgi:hypothetical protein